ncbi:general secretion pathway protein GspB [Pseudoalteromonas sp. SG44-5]|uniref:general secretion pathway protein GspB n=1 Tax=Pseudoalteromonas sp. SG44-5 TaxID=2760960 RepID=UPI0015FD2D47|nr:general secretion pathway protein GspB [Pseudoalteromonas sp. SG44-5]MBB1406739.1 general secretion pathway protein GspB [Pseudoalteromonas sp. SG44-5]
MSYLLDALKQSQQADISAEQYDLQAQQAKQQQALVRYRRLAFVIGGSLAVSFSVAGGFVSGKWLQNSSFNSNNEQVSTTAILKNTNADKEPTITTKSDIDNTARLQTAEQNIAVLAAQPSAPKTAPPEAVNTATSIQGQLVYVQTPSGIVQMLLTPQGQYIPIMENQATLQQNLNPQNSFAQGTYGQGAINQQGYSQPHYNQPSFNQTSSQATQAAGQQPQTNMPSSASLDLSKYKVLGKPLDSQGSTAQKTKRPALGKSPTLLETAFDQAIQDTEKTQNYEVTQATRSSSRVQPIELLPDGLQAMLPPLKYQAHIYSSALDKRWIKLNGRELFEGDSIGALTVREITPEQSVLDFDGYEFSLKALQDWPQ